MRKVVTSYACDGCGKSVKGERGIRRFFLTNAQPRRSWVHSDSMDLCDECEARLIEAVEPILGASVIELRREEETPKSKPGRRRVKPREERGS